MLLTVKYLGHEIVCDTTKPLQSKIAAINKNPSPTTEIEMMKFIVSMNFYSKFIVELHVNTLLRSFCKIYYIIVLDFLGILNW